LSLTARTFYLNADAIQKWARSFKLGPRWFDYYYVGRLTRPV